MLPKMNLSQTKTKGIEPNGYVVKVVDTHIDTKYNKLILDIDIAEGEHRGYYEELERNRNFWGLTLKLPITNDPDESNWQFAKAIEAFKASNPYFVWNEDEENDERNFVGNFVGVVCRRYHYYGDDGIEKSKLVVYKTLPVEDIRNGNFEVPEDSYSKDFQKMAAPAPGGVIDTTLDIPESFRMTADETPF